MDAEDRELLLRVLYGVRWCIPPNFNKCDDDYHCPLCKADRRKDHKPGCELAAAIEILQPVAAVATVIEQHEDGDG